MTTSATGIEPIASTVLAVEYIQPEGLTASRADLVRWWQWRYSVLTAENARLGDLVVQAIGEASGYRQVLQAALDTVREQRCERDRLRKQHHRLREEYRDHRARVMAVSA